MLFLQFLGQGFQRDVKMLLRSSKIENSGIDDAWLEAGVYGSTTVRQILNCSYYKRTPRAHIYMYIAVYELLLEIIFKV